MTIGKAIDLFDAQRKNSASRSLKIHWLSELDEKINTEILKPRYEAEFSGYTDSTSSDTVLLSPESYAEIYPVYLIMKNDYMNGEINRYNNSAGIFNRLYSDLSNYINRTKAVNKNETLKAGKIYDCR